MASRIAMGLLFLVAGITHFVRPGLYVRIVPPWVPLPMLVVYLSGIAEIALGAGVMVPATARPSCWGVAVLLLAIFPANVYHWTSGVQFGDAPMPGWYHPVRLPLQFVLIAWAVWNACEGTVMPSPRP